MSAERPIEVGDLVFIWKPPSHAGCNSLGAIFTVTAIRLNTDRIKLGEVYNTLCRWCGHRSLRSTTKAILVAEGAKCVVSVSRLKRIPTPAELGLVDERTDEPTQVTA